MSSIHTISLQQRQLVSIQSNRKLIELTKGEKKMFTFSLLEIIIHLQWAFVTQQVAFIIIQHIHQFLRCTIIHLHHLIKFFLIHTYQPMDITCPVFIRTRPYHSPQHQHSLLITKQQHNQYQRLSPKMNFIPNNVIFKECKSSSLFFSLQWNRLSILGNDHPVVVAHALLHHHLTQAGQFTFCLFFLKNDLLLACSDSRSSSRSRYNRRRRSSRSRSRRRVKSPSRDNRRQRRSSSYRNRRRPIETKEKYPSKYRR